MIGNATVATIADLAIEAAGLAAGGGVIGGPAGAAIALGAQAWPVVRALLLSGAAPSEADQAVIDAAVDAVHRRLQVAGK